MYPGEEEEEKKRESKKKNLRIIHLGNGKIRDRCEGVERKKISSTKGFSPICMQVV